MYHRTEASLCKKEQFVTNTRLSVADNAPPESYSTKSVTPHMPYSLLGEDRFVGLKKAATNGNIAPNSSDCSSIILGNMSAH